MVTSPSQANKQHKDITEHYPSDDIDLYQFFHTLWQGRWFIVLVTVAFTCLAAIYAQFQPKAYQAEISFIIPPPPMWEENSLLEVQIYALPLINSEEFKSELAVGLESGIALPNVYLNRSSIFTASITAPTAEKAHKSIKHFFSKVDSVYKNLLLDKVRIQTKAIKPLANEHPATSIQELSETLMVVEALLSEERFKVIQFLNTPKLPPSHIKPRSALIVMMGLFLGVIFSCGFVLLRRALIERNILHRKD
jgi:LPS O-antigen subunit length determinant protein (WzzB/FepE family)